MREYEVTVIFQTKLDDEARSAVSRARNWLVNPWETDDDKPVPNVWGQRRLAYPIRQEYGRVLHSVFDAKLDPDQRLADIERNMQYTEDVLRYLIVRKEQ